MEKVNSLTAKNITFQQEFEQLKPGIDQLVQDLDGMKVKEDESKVHLKKKISYLSKIAKYKAKNQAFNRIRQRKRIKKEKEKEQYKAKVKL